MEDAAGQPFTLDGWKEIHDDPGPDGWSDTTTLYAKLHRGEVGGEVVAAGILRVDMLDFVKLIASFRVEGPTVGDRTGALARFGAFYLGKLWDVYARRLLPYGPI